MLALAPGSQLRRGVCARLFSGLGSWQFDCNRSVVLKQKGPNKQSPQRGHSESTHQGGRMGPAASPPAIDRSMVGRKYETGSTMRSAGNAPEQSEARQHMSELDRGALDLQTQHGERLEAGSARANVSAAATAAVILTETSQLRGASGDRVPVRFEPYEFFRRTGQWLVATHRDQAAEHQVFETAKGIDAGAAHESLRMGVAQLSGQEAEAAGYDSAAAMYAGLQSGHEAQIDGLLAVIQSNGDLQSAMAAEDWRGVAELRAGPGYGALGYDDALAAYSDAYGRASASYGGGDDDDDKPKKPRKTAKKRPKK
jgi:hypothetical protein